MATTEVIDFERIGKKGVPRHYSAFGLDAPMKTVPVIEDRPQSAHPGLDEAGIAALEKEATERAWSDFRAERNRRLSATDYTQVADWPGDGPAWAEYRQKLRDLPSVTEDTLSPVWPIPPK